MTKPELIAVLPEEIQVGQPLPFPVFDAHHSLLLGEGACIQEESQLKALQEIGLFRAWSGMQREAGHHSLSVPGQGGATVPASNFAQLKLQPGMTVHLRRSDLPPHGFMAVKLLGWLAEEDLLVSATPQNGAELSLPVGAPLEVKLLAGKGVVSFQSTLLQTCHVPYPYLHLAYPQALAIRQLRKSLRVCVSLPVRVSDEGDAASYEGVLTNLSASGGLLELPLLAAQVGDELVLMFSLPAVEQEHMLVLRTVVRNVRTAGGDQPMVHYGLEFLDAATAERLLIEHFIFQNLLEN